MSILCRFRVVNDVIIKAILRSTVKFLRLYALKVYIYLCSRNLIILLYRFAVICSYIDVL